MRLPENHTARQDGPREALEGSRDRDLKEGRPARVTERSGPLWGCARRVRGLDAQRRKGFKAQRAALPVPLRGQAGLGIGRCQRDGEPDQAVLMEC